MSWTSPAVIATGTLVTAAMWNSNFSYLYDSGWVTLAAASSGYTNSWASNGGPASGATVAGLRQIGNVVRLGGSIKSGASGAIVCTLIAAYRPAYEVRCTGVTSLTATSAFMLDIGTGGACTPVFTSGTVPTLDGMTYTVD